MHPNFALANEVSMKVFDFKVVNRLRLASNSRNYLNARPGARDDAGADAQLARLDEAPI